MSQEPSPATYGAVTVEVFRSMDGRVFANVNQGGRQLAHLKAGESFTFEPPSALSEIAPSMDNGSDWDAAFEAHMALAEAISERNRDKYRAALARFAPSAIVQKFREIGTLYRTRTGEVHFAQKEKEELFPLHTTKTVYVEEGK